MIWRARLVAPNALKLMKKKCLKKTNSIFDCLNELLNHVGRVTFSYEESMWELHGYRCFIFVMTIITRKKEKWNFNGRHYIHSRIWSLYCISIYPSSLRRPTPILPKLTQLTNKRSRSAQWLLLCPKSSRFCLKLTWGLEINGYQHWNGLKESFNWFSDPSRLEPESNHSWIST